MEAKIKAKELVDRFISEGCLFANAKKCAIICVDEILNIASKIQSLEMYKFYQQVKHEIQQL